MDELTLIKKPNEFNMLRSFCRSLVADLAELRQAPLARAGGG
jgi:hypothetical protein